MARLALMIRIMLPCSVCTTTRMRPRLDMPTVTNRRSKPECSSSGNVVESVSSRTVAALWKSMPCFLRLPAAFSESHLKTTLQYTLGGAQRLLVPSWAAVFSVLISFGAESETLRHYPFRLNIRPSFLP